MKSHGEVVARMKVTETGMAPSYRLERPRGEHLLVSSGAGQTPLESEAASERDAGWSSTTMSFREISQAAQSLLSGELQELINSRPR